MPRRITTGVTGGPILGILKTLDNTISPNTDNQDIDIVPSGTGETRILSNLDIRSANSLKFSDSDNTNFVAFASPSAIATDITWTLPGSDGSNGQALLTNGSGSLSFGAVTLGVNNDTTNSGTFYPALTDVTSGAEGTLTVSSSKLSFQPSTGTLTATTFSGAHSGDGSGLSNVAADNVGVTNNSSTNGTFYPTFVNGTSGDRGVTVDNQMTYNPSSGEFTAQIVTASSDATLKEDINPLTGALEKISQLTGMHYKRKRTGLPEAGLVAQEVEKVIPEVVYTGQDGLKSIAYGNIVAYLIEAVKEQSKEIASLKDKLSSKE